ncbi:MAG: S8 family serine peptidase [Chromatiales bacterium]|nr:S8 family serine peptidase [Gammaproteobacteria bacterium]
MDVPFCILSITTRLRLSSLVLEESQDRFAPVTVSSAPFAGSGSLIVPLDFLVNGTVKFNARVEDESGERHNLDTTTLIVGGAPNTNLLEQGFVTPFPTLYLEAPTEGLPNQQLSASAIAPAARVHLELPVPPALAGTPDLLLMRLTELAGEPKLALVDRLEIVEVDGTPMLMTSGRDLPGATSSAIYVVVASDQPLVAVTGRNTGSAATIALDGTPFVFETEGPNAAFNLPVVAATAFLLSFNDPVTGGVNGMASGQAPVIGSLDIGEPLGAVAGTLYVDARPGADALVDIGDSLKFKFSEPIDTTTLSGNIVVTDNAGNRVFGRTTVTDDATRVTFTPMRRWGFGRSYRYGISPRLLALSGARLAQPFGDEFTTFMPRLLDGNTLGDARDVAVSGNLALVGGDAGLSIVDISVVDAPVVLHEIPVAGGVSGVALLESANLIDRDGNSVAGTLGFAVSGADAGLLQVFDLNTADTPLMLGSSQLSTPAGQTPQTGVPDSPGIPTAIAVGPGQQALVAVQIIGVESVDTGQAIPDDPANPGGALSARFPASTLETANDVAVLGDKLLVAGINGLTVLDVASLAFIGNVSTTGNAQGVAGIADFEMDVNGDGSVDPSTEIFDLAVVANGADGTIQFFDLRIPANPALISAVRVNHTVNSVALSRNEGLAFIGCGTNGVALVDLSGPSSIQPIDLDFDTLDDRVLGQVSTSGSAGAVALDLTRGVGYVADGASGLSVVQLLPPRTAFTQIQRDPVAAISGEEQSILDSRVAFVTDDELEITISAVIPPRSGLYLAIEEVPSAGGETVVKFPDGTTSAPLSSGSNLLVARIGDLPSTGSLVSLKIQDQGGRLLDRFDLELSLPDIGDTELVSLFVAPEEMTIPADGQTAQISVGGQFSNGLSLNLTGSSSGTQYSPLGTTVATVDTEGLVTAVAGGRTTVQVSNAGRGADVGIDVQQPPALTGIRLDQTSLTLVTPGAQVQLQVTGLMSDQSDADLTLDSGTQYDSDAANVVTVDSNGLISATGEGLGVVSVSNGAFTDSVRIAVEFRTPPDVAAIDLAPFTGPVRTDRGQVLMQAGISGTGSLEGLTISFSILNSGLAPMTAVTDYSGVALAGIVESLGAGSYTVEASIIDPASGDVLIDAESLVVTAASGDIEPNDTLGSASIIDQDMPINGGLDGSTDAIDNFRMTSSTGGTLTLILELAEGTALSDVTVRLLSSDGSVLAVFTPDAEYSSFEFDILAGDSYLEVGNGAGLLDYSLSTSVEAGPLEVLSVSPAAGGTATLVTIAGSGFSALPSANMVQFGGIMGEMVSATSTQLQVLVPANATDGPVEVVVGSQRVSGPEFLTGNTGPPPTPTGSRLDPDSVRRDPVTGLEIVVNQLIVRFRPIVEGAEVEDLALGLDGQVVGYLPLSNTYLLEFPAIETIKGLHALEQALDAEPRVLFASRNALGDSRGRLDTRDGVANHHSDAYRLAGIFEATERIRGTPPFDDPSNFAKVHIAFIDWGFSPVVLQEFDFAYTQVHELECPSVETGPCTTELVQYSPDPSGHGTAMVSIVGMDNDNTAVNGILSGIYQPDEGEQIRNKNNNTFSIYASPETHFQAAQALLLIANDSGLMVDVVVLGWGWDYDSPSIQQQGCISLFTPVLANMLDRTLVVVPAGNADRNNPYDCPGSLSVDPALGNVMTVGGITVHPGNQGRRLPGSNYGPTITLAAPAEDILAVNSDHDFPYVNRTGTSYAAAMVAGVAGMLQAIHDCSAAGADVCPDPPVPRFKPAELKKILLETAKDNSSSWDQGDMKRLNALGAVHEVLPRLDRQAIYVADQDAFNGTGQPLGRLIAIDVDPITGEPGLSQVVPLKLDVDSQTLTGARPTALETCGPFLFVVVEDASGNLGDGVMQFYTPLMQPMAFYPFSGAKFPVPDAGNSQSKVKLMTNRPGMVCSKDRTLLYVGGTRGIIIINIVERKLVNRLSDLPDTANMTPADITAFDERRVNLGQLFDIGIPTLSGYKKVTMVSCLELSPDGKTLYACLSTGRGKGSQPGAILPINVDLYKDAKPEQGLQTDFSDYLSLSMNYQNWPSTNPQDGVEKLMMLMKNPGSTVGGDEPSDVAVSADGKYLYLLNGGVFEYQGILDGKFPPEYYEALAGGQAIGAASSATSGGIDGLLQGLSNLVTQISGVYADLLHDLLEDLKKGKTLLSAPGYTGTFAAKTHQVTGGTYLQGDRIWFFPPEVLFGWNVSTSDNSLLLDQSYQPQVFVKRPFAMSFRPTPGPVDNPFSSSRALVAFHQTGNFGVLDLIAQREFQQAPPSGSESEGVGPHPAFAQLPSEMFQGVVGVTPAIPLDAHLWPRRGLLPLQSSGPTFTSPLLPSPDEALLFTNDLVYAQSGRFAVASHAGFGSPITYKDVVVDDFLDSELVRARLEDLGFTISGTTATGAAGTLDEGVQFIQNGFADFRRGGGAISIIHDEPITDDFIEHFSTTVSEFSEGSDRAYFSVIPVCKKVSGGASGPLSPACEEEVTARVYDYRTPDSTEKKRFHRPRGIAIDQFVYITFPRFGAHIGTDDDFTVEWRDPRVKKAEFHVYDLDDMDSNGIPQLVSSKTFNVTTDEKDIRRLRRDLTSLIDSPLEHLQRYRIKVRLLLDTAVLGGQYLFTHVDVTYD